MCLDPVTLAVIATAVAVTSAGVSTLAAANQATGQARVARENARQSDLAAADAIQRGKIENMQHGRQLGQMKGTQAATMGANAGDLSFGSNLAVQQDTAFMGRQDGWMVQGNFRREAMGYDISAANYRSEASAATSARSGIIAAGALDMASTVLGGAQQMQGMKAPKAEKISVTPQQTRMYQPTLRY